MEKIPNTRRIELNGEYDISQRQAIASLFEELRSDGPVIMNLTKWHLRRFHVLEQAHKMSSAVRRTFNNSGWRKRRCARLAHREFDEHFEVSD